MSASNKTTLPVVGQPFLDGFREELADQDNHSCRKVFVADFAGGYPRRFGRLRLALTTGDLDGSLNAVRDLRLASHAVGAERLCGLLSRLESDLLSPARESDGVALPRLAAAYLRPVDQCGSQTLQGLQGPYAIQQ